MILTVGEVKNHLRIEEDDEDSYIESLIRQAQATAEDFCRASLDQQFYTDEDGIERTTPVPEPVRLAV